MGTCIRLTIIYLLKCSIYLSVAFFTLKIVLYGVAYCTISHEEVRVNSRDNCYSPMCGNVKHIPESHRKNTIVVFESVYNNLWNRFLMLSCIVPYPELSCVKHAIDRGASNFSRCLRKLLKSLNKNPTMCSLDHIEIIEYLLTETRKHKTKLMIDCVRTVKYFTIVCQANYSWCSGLIWKFQSVANRVSMKVEPYYDALCRTISHNCLLERTVVSQTTIKIDEI